MNNLLKLVRGELARLNKNKILPISIFVSLIWVLIIGFSPIEEVMGLIPMLLVADAGMMSIIYLAASFYFEKQEGSIKSQLVLPVKVQDILFSKVLASIVLSLASTIVIVLTVIFVHQLKINLFLLFVYIILIVSSHAALGFVIILNSRDFGQMLGIYAAYALLFFLPTILSVFEIIPKRMDIYLLISPTHAAQTLLQSPFTDMDFLSELIAFFYLLFLGFGIFLFYVNKKFKEYAIAG
jgi:fluoroquinolone transport system permease protein